MPATSSSSPLHSLVLLLCRLALGGVFVEAGLTKLLKMGLSGWYAKGYMPMIPPWMRDWHWFNQPYGHAIPFLEVTVGALVVLGLFGRAAAGIMALLVLSFTIALLNARGGGGATPYIHTNWVLFGLALLLTVTGPGALSLDALWRGGKAGA
jgi:uncharacterized membrane protein YphA (DoxX/SURF4 family)